VDDNGVLTLLRQYDDWRKSFFVSISSPIDEHSYLAGATTLPRGLGFAFAYPALAEDPTTGEVAISLMWGGGSNYANHAVGFLGDFVVSLGVGEETSHSRMVDVTYGSLGKLPHSQMPILQRVLTRVPGHGKFRCKWRSARHPG
jgi:hypothetical protein